MTCYILNDVVIFLEQQESSFRAHNESRHSLNRGTYMEMLTLLAVHDAASYHSHSFYRNFRNNPKYLRKTVTEVLDD